MLSFYKTINDLSIDVAAGAMVSGAFFNVLLGVEIQAPSILCLGLTVWTIYTADHLMDVRDTSGPAATSRHQFHQHHYHLLQLIVIVVALITVVLVFFVPQPILAGGIMLSIVVGIYFLIQRKLRFLKELIGAVLYTAGVLLPSLPLLRSAAGLTTWLLIIQFALTALINLVLFSWFDMDSDIQDRRRSLVTTVGFPSAKKLLIGLFALQGSITIFLFASSGQYLTISMLAMMNFVLLMMLLKHRDFELNDRYRFAGDAIFFIPLISLLIIES